MENTMKTIETMVVKQSGDKVFQTQRNEIKQLLLNGLHDLLRDKGFTVDLVLDGVTLTIPNDEIGDFFATVDITVRNLTYDIEKEVQDYADKTQERAERQAEKEKKHQENLLKRAGKTVE